MTLSVCLISFSLSLITCHFLPSFSFHQTSPFKRTVSLRIGELPSTLQRQMRAQSDSIPPGGANPGVSGVVNGVHGGATNGIKSTAAAQNGTNGHFDLESPTGSVISGEKSKLGLLRSPNAADVDCGID